MLEILTISNTESILFKNMKLYLKGYALFRRPLLASRGCQLAGLLGPENRLENRGFFGDVTDPEFGIWGW